MQSVFSTLRNAEAPPLLKGDALGKVYLRNFGENVGVGQLNNQCSMLVRNH